MELRKRLQAFEKLGQVLGELSEDPALPFIQKAEESNPWFTEDFIRKALAALAGTLTKESLEKWIGRYPELNKPSVLKKIGVIMAGNIPLVGFHDMLTVLISGNAFIGKPSSKDGGLHKAVADLLISTEPAFKNLLFITEEISGHPDAVIATGSDNTARYFEYNYRDIPHLIRKNRNAIAVLDGKESQKELEVFGEDVFAYFGLGCRNVSTILLPAGYPLQQLIDAWTPWRSLISHKKYRSNYRYYKAILETENIPYTDSDSFLFQEDMGIASPVGVIYIQYYSSVKEITRYILSQANHIQCVVSHMSLKSPVIPFGHAQYPELMDYADGIDTMKFLLELD